MAKAVTDKATSSGNVCCARTDADSLERLARVAKALADAESQVNALLK